MYYMLYLCPNPNGLTIGHWQSSCSLQPVARWTGCDSPKPHARPHATGCKWFQSSCTKNGAYKIPVQSSCLVRKAKRPDWTGLLNSTQDTLSPEKLVSWTHPQATLSRNKLVSLPHPQATLSPEKLVGQTHPQATLLPEKLISWPHPQTTPSPEKVVGPPHPQATLSSDNLVGPPHSQDTLSPINY